MSYTLGVALVAVMLAAVGAWIQAASRVVRQSDLSAQVLRLEGVAALVVTVAMIPMVVGTALWWGAMAADAPRFFAGASSGFAIPPGMVVTVAMMAVGLVLALGGARRVLASLAKLTAKADPTSSCPHRGWEIPPTTRGPGAIFRGAQGRTPGGGVQMVHVHLAAPADPVSAPSRRGAARPQWPSLRIADALGEEYGNGVPPNTPLPSERSLAERFGVQRPTVRVALEYLAQQGLIYRRERLGWFVNPPRLEYNPLGPGIPKERLRIEVVTTDPSGQPKAPFKGLQFLALRRYYFDERLVVAAHLYLRSDLKKAVTEADLNAPLRDYLDAVGKRTGVTQTHNRLTVVAAAVGPDLAPILGVSTRQPILDVTRLHCSGEDIIGVDLEHWRSDVVTITFEGRRIT